MSVECPYCQHVIKLKGVKAGRYSPKCPKCARGFNLIVSGEEDSYQFVAKPMAELKSPDAPPKPASPPPAPPELKTQAPVRTAPPPAPPRPADKPSVPAAKAGPSPKAAPGRSAEPGRPPMAHRRDTDPGDRTEILESEITGPELPSTSAPATSAAMEETAFLPGADAAADDRTIVGDVVDEPADFDVDAPALAVQDADRVPNSLGGYELQKKLGKGGMGTVLLARQVSLDRPVALKVMNPRWASDPTFVARFTREAYAAAQLVHHNIVQIYDIGEEQGFHFFSMEYVKGCTLSELVKEKGKLDVEEAVGYTLQAARGLKFAHDQGMVHRDVKPDNLMLNDQGVVKVADLGLVKTPGAVEAEIEAEKQPEKRKPSSLSSMPSVTTAGTAMGTPAYMAPEQGKNAADVDGRADIYSLGCTLYVLLTGQPPFTGTTAMEVMVKHLTEPVVPPETIAKRVPKEISAILLKMMAKKREERYGDMGQVIAELERFLGVQRAGPFTPSEEHAETLDQCAKAFNAAPAARMRARVWPVFWLSCAVLTLLCALFGQLRLAGGIIGLGVLTAVFSFLVTGFTQKTYLYLRVRAFLVDSDWRDWLMWGVSFLLALALLYVIGLLVYWLLFLLVAAGLAAAYHFFVEQPLRLQRGPALEKAEKLLKGMRLRGLSEEAIRQFVCKYSGDRWEEFFEHLFGYENLVQARTLWARPDGGRPRQTFAGWRDFLVQWLDARQRARKEVRERRLLQALEQKKLQAEGLDAAAAKAKATQTADVMVSQAAEIKVQAARQAAVPQEATAARVESFAEHATVPMAPTEAHLPATAFTASPQAPPVNVKTLLLAAEKPEEISIPVKPAAGGVGAFTLFPGAHIRFLIGAVLLAACFLWMNQNSLIPDSDLDFKEFGARATYAHKEWPLKILPAPIDRVFSGFGVGVAGLILVLSALTNRGKLLGFLLLAALIAWFGPLLVPDIGPVSSPYVCIIAALALAEFGVVFERTVRPKSETV